MTIYPTIFKSVLSALKTGQNDSKVSNVRSGTCRYCNRSRSSNGVSSIESNTARRKMQEAANSNSVAVNASLGRCVKPDLQAENADESDESDESDDEEEEDDE